jgi:hypothetical protein
MSVIHYYSLCWNEEKILPFTLGYYSRFCEKLVIMDNESDDSSPSIIKSYNNTEIRTYHSNSEIRDDIYLEIKNNIWKESRGKADWVIMCDTDEFLYHPNLPEKLDELKQKGVSIVRPYGFDMFSATFPEKNIFEVKNGIKENRHLRKCIIFNPNLIDEINFKAGCHKCKPEGKVKFYKKSDIKLLHYKSLSLEYLLTRYDLMSQRLSNYNIENRLGKHYLQEKQHITKMFYQKLKKAKKIIE